VIRVGIEESVPRSLLNHFGKHVQIVRIPRRPTAPIEVNFYVAPLHFSDTCEQWPYLRGVQVVQSIFAGIDALLKLIPGSVTLCDARGVHDIPISEWAVGAVLAMQKFFPFYFELQRNRDWRGRSTAEQIYLLQQDAEPSPYCPILVDELTGKTVLILGYGSIGQAIEERLKPFGVFIRRVARTERPGVTSVADLDSILPLADILICILPETSETRGLLDERRLGLLKRGALFVNAGRGTTMDAHALARALAQRRLRAALDVVHPEPLPPEHPLWGAPNLLITPHVAGDSTDFLKRAFQFAAEQAQRLAAGECLRNIVIGEY
jgi:phosphoglycerate dehydrogenase-like enzyme